MDKQLISTVLIIVCLIMAPFGAGLVDAQILAPIRKVPSASLVTRNLVAQWNLRSGSQVKRIKNTLYNGTDVNLVPFSADLTKYGWTKSFSGTIDNSTTYTTGQQFAGFYTQIPTVQGQTYTLSFYARSISGQTSWHIDHTGATEGAFQATPITLTGSFQRFTATVVTGSATGYIKFGLEQRNATWASQIEVTQIQVEKGSSATTYEPTPYWGDLWLGGTDATTSNDPTLSSSGATFAAGNFISSVLPAPTALSSWTLTAVFKRNASEGNNFAALISQRVNSSNTGYHIYFKDYTQNGLTKTNVIGGFLNGASVYSAGAYVGGAVQGVPTLLNQWTVVTATYDGTTIRTYRDGILITSSVPGAASNPAQVPIYVGANYSNNLSFLGVISEVLIHDAALTPSEVRNEFKYEQRKLASAGIALKYRPLIISDGDSLSTGFNMPDQTGAWPEQLIAGFPATDWHYIAIAGQTIAATLANAAANVDPLYNPNRPANVVVVWAGTNDLPSRTADAVYADIVSYAQGRRAAGFKVVVVTLTPRGDVDIETKRTALNSNIRANWSTFADALADVGNDSTIGCSSCALNTTYYNADKLHLITAGYTIVKNIIQTAVTSVVRLQ